MKTLWETGTFKVGSPVRFYCDVKGFWVRGVIVAFAVTGQYAYLRENSTGMERLIALNNLILIG